MAKIRPSALFAATSFVTAAPSSTLPQVARTVAKMTPAALHTEYTSDPRGYYTGRNTEGLLREAINERRGTIQVERTSVDKGTSAGKVVDTLPRQLVGDAIVESELTTITDPNRSALFFYLNQGELQFTDELKSNLLGIITQQAMPLSRANLVALVDRDGSRAEELQGEQVSEADNRAAQDYGLSLQPPQPLW